ncbi:UPF0481 protein At3g47200-like [Trifolium pratense]|uniref:UPF0481 protein At3g47200-like n=1 Tax=Trifolium pratense TaxID=57577 RepID=UPI001E697B9A|nr:UPF0481 protein At3g47200-like [Trifolium pratense]
MELEMEWMDKINEEVKNNGHDEKEQWRKHSIYKIPSQITDLNEKAYKPRAISFGPYHNGEEKLKAMEEHKHRVLVHFLKRCKKPIELLFQCLDQVAQELRDSYKPLDLIWTNDTPKFIQMMILDGCFILEFLRVDNSEIPFDDYGENDLVFGKHGNLHVLPFVERDMLILENQIPMIVLHILSEFAGEGDHHELNMKIIKLLNPIFIEDTPSNEKIIELGKCMHILDLYRKTLIQEPSHTTPIPKLTRAQQREEDISKKLGWNTFPRVQESGIHFHKSKTSSLRDFWFSEGVLWLPRLIIDDNTEYMFLNLMAFERLHNGAGNEITSFILFMDAIVDSVADVSILYGKGILVNTFGTDETVAELFNSMSKEIPKAYDKKIYNVTADIYYFCGTKPWKRWRASLIETYFRNPWTMVSLVVGIIFFVLTIVQTIYTILSFYHDC